MIHPLSDALEWATGVGHIPLLYVYVFRAQPQETPESIDDVMLIPQSVQRRPDMLAALSLQVMRVPPRYIDPVDLGQCYVRHPLLPDVQLRALYPSTYTSAT